MAEVSGAARVAVGKSHAATSAEVKVTAVLIGLLVILAACVLSWTAQGATPRRLFWVHKLTEHEGPAQDFQDHLAHAAELLTKPVLVPVVFPDRTAPGITATMHQGFRTATWQTSDSALEHGGGQTEAW